MQTAVRGRKGLALPWVRQCCSLGVPRVPRCFLCQNGAPFVSSHSYRRLGHVDVAAYMYIERGSD
eukprot:641925-Pyramimonas_sp.AAC.1